MASTPKEEKVLNVYQKLIKARQMFLNGGAKKTGKNMALEFKYFELADIVPLATEIFNEVGLIAIVSYDMENALMNVVNTDNPDEVISFTSPMRFTEPNRGTNPLQALGASHTYLRRYLYMMALDICEPDSVEPALKKEVTEDTEVPTPASAKAKKPATKEEREEIKKELTNTDGMADELQIKALKAALKKLKEIDPSQEEFIQQIAVKTDSFTKIAKGACETLVLKIGEMIENYGVQEDAENGMA